MQTYSDNYKIKAVRLWLISVLLILPFQQYIIRIEILSGNLVKLISLIDELTIVLLFPLALIELFRNKIRRKCLYFVLLLPFFFMTLAGVISGMINGNLLYISIAGIFDYIKNFLVLFVFVAFFKEMGGFKQVFRPMLIITVVIGIFGLIQELWALVSVYIFNKDIYDPGIYILRKAPTLIEEGWRSGLYRTASLMYNYNMLGLYSLLIISVYLFTEKKINFLIFIALFSGIVASGSRMSFLGFVILAVIQILRGRKWLLILLIPVMIILFNEYYITINSDIMPASRIRVVVNEEEEMSRIVDDTTYRSYSSNKALEVWKDHPIWGVGPGLFGGPVSIKNKSHYYEEYNFDELSYMEQVKGLDQFWPQLIAETGIVGSGMFISILSVLFIVLYFKRQQTYTFEKRGLCDGLLFYIVIIVSYGFGSGLNLASVLFTFSAFAGIAVAYND